MGSFLKFNYALRPAKQVERKMLVEALLRLASCDYPIHDYTYLGFGSVYYADFQVFNRYLYIDSMICVEAGDIPKRMAFNRPLGDIELRMERLAETIPCLDRDRRYFAWLDYDVPLCRDVLSDVRSLTAILAPGSILVVTVDAEARVRFEPPYDDLNADQIRELRVAELAEELDAFVDISVADYDNSTLPDRFAEALASAIRQEASDRGDVQFSQLFNYKYRDGAQMLSLGGVLDHPERVAALETDDFMRWEHLNQDTSPAMIAVPPLTANERLELEHWVTTVTGAGELPFELDDNLVAAFAKYRRYYPQYFESIT
jgi:hypothetical protein